MGLLLPPPPPLPLGLDPPVLPQPMAIASRHTSANPATTLHFRPLMRPDSRGSLVAPRRSNIAATTITVQGHSSNTVKSPGAPTLVLATGVTAQVTPDKLDGTGTEHEKVGVPAKPLTGVTVTLAVPQVPCVTVRACVESDNWKSGGVALPETGETEVQLVTRLKASTDPSPVAKSYPAPAAYPMETGLAEQSGVFGWKGTLLSPVVMS